MEKVHPWSGQPSDRGRLKDRTEQKFQVEDEAQAGLEMSDQLLVNASSKTTPCQPASVQPSSRPDNTISHAVEHLNQDLPQNTWTLYQQHRQRTGHFAFSAFSLQRFDTFGWGSGRASGLQKLSGEVLLWLYVWKEVQVVCIWYS